MGLWSGFLFLYRVLVHYHHVSFVLDVLMQTDIDSCILFHYLTV
jgi:hypothetical protein